jgi:hypothetical protein
VMDVAGSVELFVLPQVRFFAATGFALGVHRGIKGAEGQDTCSLSKRPLIVNSKILYYNFRGC